jgi:predicted deacylase
MSIRIGDIKAKKGEKKTGFITAVEIPIGTIDLPITLINGTRSGPILAITAGVHGCEYPGIRGAQIIARETKPSEMVGAIIIVHNVNVPGFNHQTAFINPFDGINLHNIWPGNVERGARSMSHHIVNTVYEEVQKKATHYIDLHGGDLPEDLPHYAASVMTGDNKVDDISRAMLRYSLAKYITERAPRGDSSSTAAELKIPNLLHESGRAGLLEKESVTKHVEAIRNIMTYLGMKKDKLTEPPLQIKYARASVVRAKHGGFFESLVEPGEIVSGGHTIGKIFNVFGEIVEEIKAPKDGVILITHFRAPKYVGDRLFSIYEVID